MTLSAATNTQLRKSGQRVCVGARAADLKSTQKGKIYMLLNMIGATLDVSTLIGNYAFPIAACICMAGYVKEIQKEHGEEVAKLRDVLERNTIALEKIVSKLGGDNNEM